MFEVRTKISRVIWTRDPFSAKVDGHSTRADGVEWDWLLEFTDPFQLISFLVIDINTRETD